MTETVPAPAAETEPTALAVYDHSNSNPAAAAMTDEKDDDVEDQKDDTAAAASSFDNEAGKGIGIAIFVLLAVAFIAGLLGFTISELFAYVSLICLIAALIMASVITCGCCCASNYNLSPKVKRWSTAVMLCLVVQFVIIAIAIIIGFAGVGAVTTTVISNIPTTSIDGRSTIIKSTVTTTTNPISDAMLIIAQILYILPCVFAGIFTWGRNSCGNSNSA